MIKLFVVIMKRIHHLKNQLIKSSLQQHFLGYILKLVNYYNNLYLSMILMFLYHNV